MDLLCCDCGGDHITLGSAWVALAGVWGSGPFLGFRCSYTNVLIQISSISAIMLNHACCKTCSIKTMMPTAQGEPHSLSKEKVHVYSATGHAESASKSQFLGYYTNIKNNRSKTTSLRTHSSPPHPSSASSFVPMLPVGVPVGTTSHATNRSFLAVIGSASVGCGIAIVSRAVVCSLHT